MQETKLKIANRQFKSRLFIGTGKFSSTSALKDCIYQSQTELITVALRRINLQNPEDDILKAINPQQQLILPNTSGARNAEEAIRLAKIAREAIGHAWVKLEVTPQPDNLLPDPVESFKAAKALVKEGFNVMPYINADPILAKRLEDIGCVTVMPLGSPIGTNKGLKTRDQIAMIIEQSNIPVVVDAGIGAPSHATEAMEMGANAVLVNTALAVSGNPAMMGLAFKLAVESGRKAFIAGLGSIEQQAKSSSPLTGFLRDEIN